MVAPVKNLVTLSDFSLGELSPLIRGRPAENVYHKGASSFINFRPCAQGGFTKAIGTLYQGHSASDLVGRPVRLVVSQSLAYVLEFTNYLLRFWKFSGGILTYLSGKDVPTIFPLNDLDSQIGRAHV